MKWLVAEEKVILERVEEMIEQGENVNTQEMKKLRSQVRVPAMYRDIQLSKDQMDEIEADQNEQVDYYCQRAIRKLEEGSAYSSDFEDKQISEYYSTDGEGQGVETEVYEKASI